jgi:hypothetical protein
MDWGLGLGIVGRFLLKDELLSRQIITSTRQLLSDTATMIALSWEERVYRELTTIFRDDALSTRHTRW